MRPWKIKIQGAKTMSEQEEKYLEIVEINGVKIEVDLRTAKKVQHFKVGDKIKVLCKKYTDYQTYPGIILEFNGFKKLPSMVIAYLDMDYSAADIKFITYNSESKDVEITHPGKWDVQIDKADVIDRLEKEIFKKKEEIKDLENKKSFFLSNFNRYFSEIENG